MRGKNDDARGGEFLDDLPGRFQTIEQGHGDVHDDDVWTEFPG